MPKEEFILAVKSSFVKKNIECNGCVVPGIHPYTSNSFSNEDVFIGRREGLESDFDFRQFITYVTFVNRNGEVYLYQRTKANGEEKLFGLHSVGFGGHVEISDVNYDSDGIVDVIRTLNSTLWRELREECGLRRSSIDGESVESVNTRDWIASNGTETDSLHLGLSAVVHLHEEAEIASDEASQILKGWFPIDTILNEYELEPWSRLVLEKLKIEMA